MVRSPVSNLKIINFLIWRMQDNAYLLKWYFLIHGLNLVILPVFSWHLKIFEGKEWQSYIHIKVRFLMNNIKTEKIWKLFAPPPYYNPAEPALVKAHWHCRNNSARELSAFAESAMAVNRVVLQHMSLNLLEEHEATPDYSLNADEKSNILPLRDANTEDDCTSMFSSSPPIISGKRQTRYLSNC